MKKYIFTISPIIIAIFAYTLVFDSTKFKNEDSLIAKFDLSTENEIIISPEVQKVIDNSCVGCHKTESKNNKGKAKLDFDKIKNGEYSSGKTMSKLRGIIKTLNEKKMPPKKFVKKYPERAISEKDAKIIVDWAKTQGKALKK